MSMSLSMHNVVSISVQTVNEYKSEFSPFCARTITITDASGNKLEITLFADNSESLQFDARV